jgi:type IV pilus assembly protein PilN
VILINLLPHREVARKRRKDLFNLSVGLAALLGGILAGLTFLVIQSQTEAQQARNQLLRNEIKIFDAQIKDIANLEAEITALQARQQAVEDLQSDRNMPVYLLSELVRLLPDGVYVKSLTQTGQDVALLGTAQSNERVSELLRNLNGGSPWFTQPQLVEIVAGSVKLSDRDQRRVANFNLRFKVLRTSELAKQQAAQSSSAAKLKP